MSGNGMVSIFLYREGLEGFRIFHLGLFWVYFILGLFYFGSILSHNCNY